MSLVLRQRGWLPLHASAIELEGRALLFMGKSGAGKSTLAAAFETGGHPLLADDVVGIRNNRGRNMALPGFRRVRLDPAAAAATALSGLPSLQDGEKRSVDLSRGDK